MSSVRPKARNRLSSVIFHAERQSWVNGGNPVRPPTFTIAEQTVSAIRVVNHSMAASRANGSRKTGTSGRLNPISPTL